MIFYKKELELGQCFLIQQIMKLVLIIQFTFIHVSNINQKMKATLFIGIQNSQQDFQGFLSYDFVIMEGDLKK